MPVIRCSPENCCTNRLAQCEIKAKGISKKKRTIGAPAFQYFKEVEGRFSHFLKKNPEEEGGSTLH